MSTTTKSPADMLADAARALYGDHWRLQFARDTGIREDTIRHWMTGRSTLAADHPVFQRTIDLLRQRAKWMEEIAVAIERRALP